MRRVVVRYDGGDDRYLGHEIDGTIRYDDGDEQSGVDPAWIRYVEQAQPTVGLRVEARVPGDTRVYPGIVVSVAATTCAIDFDDGDHLELPFSQVFVEKVDEQQLWDAILDDDGAQDLFTDDQHDDDLMSKVPDDDDDAVFDADAAFQPTTEDRTPQDDDDLSYVVEHHDAVPPEEQQGASSDGGWDHDAPVVVKSERQRQQPRVDGWGYEPGDWDDAGISDDQDAMVDDDSIVAPALWRLLVMLRSSLTAFNEAPAETRLTALLYEAAALEQARAHNEVTGHTWESGGPRFDWMSKGRKLWAIAHVDALLQLRMRIVAVCRIKYGSTSIETLRSLLDLAEAYARHCLWPQVASHADRATRLLWTLEAEEATSTKAQHRKDDIGASILDVFDRLEALSHRRSDGRIFWRDFVSALASVPGLAEQPWGVRQGEDDAMTWKQVVSFLRAHHAGFAATVRKVERSVPVHDLALLVLAFDAAATSSQTRRRRHPEPSTDEDGEIDDSVSTGVASAAAVRTALVRMPLAAAAFGGTGFATWLASRCRDDARLAWEQAVCALARTTRQTSVGELQARAQLLVGRAHAAGGRLTEAREALEAALATSREHDAAPHAALADVLVAEHVQWHKRAESRAKKAAEQWLQTDDGHQLWRAEVRRLVAEMRVRGTPGLVQLTRPEIECRARDVLLHARLQYHLKKDKEDDEKRPASRLVQAERQLEAAFQCELATYGAHRNNLRAALATAALGNLAVVSGDHDAAVRKLEDAVALLSQATRHNHQAASAAANVQLGRLLRKNATQQARAAECLAAAAHYYVAVAEAAANAVDKYTSLDAVKSATTENKARHASAHSARVELASQARMANAKTARGLWTDVATILRALKADGDLGDNLIAVHGYLVTANRLADGEASVPYMKALRKLAKLQAGASQFQDAAATYLDLHTIAHRLGATDIAKKAARARTTALAHRQPETCPKLRKSVKD